MLWSEQVYFFFQHKSAQLPHSVIFHFSYLLHLEGCHRGEVCSERSRKASVVSREIVFRLVLNSPVTMSLSCV